VPNAALLGGFAAVSGQVSIDAVEQALRQKFAGAIGEGNVVAAREAYEFVRREIEEASHAQTD